MLGWFGSFAFQKWQILQNSRRERYLFSNDPVQFPKPSKFYPERFLDKDGNVQKHDYLVPFVIGKRVCMGESLVKNEMFLFFVRVIQRINIRVIDGKQPYPNEFIEGVTRIPKPYNILVSSMKFVKM